MNRRSFLSSLAAFTATMAMDPEKALWVPGKLVSIPNPPPIPPQVVMEVFTPNLATDLQLGDIITIGGDQAKYVVNPVSRMLERPLRLREFVIVEITSSGYELRPYGPAR